MPPENRTSPPGDSRPRRAPSPPFCRVERLDADGRPRYFVVHTESPKFVVEFDPTPATASGSGAPADGGAQARQRPVIRRVCVPNDWAGDYHRCARRLGAAADFFAATEAPET